MRTVFRTIDSINEWMGKCAAWLCPILVLVLCFEVTARYVFGRPTMWAHAMASYLLCMIIALGWGYVHRYREHVRVDVIYAHLPPRGKLIVDTVFTFLFLLPVLGVVAYASYNWAYLAWATGEVYTETFWYPPTGPLKTAVLLGVGLFFLQGVVQFIRDLYQLIRSKSYD